MVTVHKKWSHRTCKRNGLRDPWFAPNVHQKCPLPKNGLKHFQSISVGWKTTPLSSEAHPRLPPSYCMVWFCSLPFSTRCASAIFFFLSLSLFSLSYFLCYLPFGSPTLFAYFFSLLPLSFVISQSCRYVLFLFFNHCSSTGSFSFQSPPFPATFPPLPPLACLEWPSVTQPQPIGSIRHFLLQHRGGLEGRPLRHHRRSESDRGHE